MGRAGFRQSWVKWMLRRRSRFNRLRRPFEYREMRNAQERFWSWWRASPVEFKPVCLSGFRPHPRTLRFLILEHRVEMARALCTLFQFEFKPGEGSPIGKTGHERVVCWVLSSAGPDAQNVLQAMRALRPHLVTLEPRLPGARGMELVQRLSRFRKTSPVIIISTVMVPDEIHQAFNLGAAGYFIKPFDPDALMARIRTLFEDLHRVNPETPS